MAIGRLAIDVGRPKAASRAGSLSQPVSSLLKFGRGRERGNDGNGDAGTGTLPFIHRANKPASSEAITFYLGRRTVFTNRLAEMTGTPCEVLVSGHDEIGSGMRGREFDKWAIGRVAHS